jgi:hypothetical protein
MIRSRCVLFLFHGGKDAANFAPPKWLECRSDYADQANGP